jgi:hypothetical protein
MKKSQQTISNEAQYPPLLENQTKDFYLARRFYESIREGKIVIHWEAGGSYSYSDAEREQLLRITSEALEVYFHTQIEVLKTLEGIVKKIEAEDSEDATEEA